MHTVLWDIGLGRVPFYHKLVVLRIGEYRQGSQSCFGVSHNTLEKHLEVAGKALYGRSIEQVRAVFDMPSQPVRPFPNVNGNIKDGSAPIHIDWQHRVSICRSSA